MARIHFAVIAGEYYPIPAESLAAVEVNLLQAVRAGGAFVSFGDAGHAVEVLVSPATPVRLEHTRIDDDGSDVPTDEGIGPREVDGECWSEFA